MNAVMLHRHISLAGGRQLLQSHSITHYVHPIVLYMLYGNLVLVNHVYNSKRITYECAVERMQQ
jgi:hypothetical protein